MFNRVVLGLTLASLSVGVEVQTPVGPEVSVMLASGEKYNGEILAVRDSSVVFSTVHGATKDELAAARGTIRILAHSEILTLGVPGSSNFWLGSVLGCATGGLIGYWIGNSQEVKEQKSNDCSGNHFACEKEANAIGGSLIGACAGTGIGALVGSGIKDKIDLISPQNRDFSVLKGLARYKKEEPEFLREKR